MSISAREAQKSLPALIEGVNADQDVIEIVSPRGNAVLMSAEEYASWQRLISSAHPVMPAGWWIPVSRPKPATPGSSRSIKEILSSGQDGRFITALFATSIFVRVEPFTHLKNWICFNSHGELAELLERVS